MLYQNLLRQQIIKACRRLDQLGFVAASDGNVSSRVDDKDILITPSGLAKGELGPEQILLTDIEGRIIRGEGSTSSEIKMHLYAYRMRPDIKAVVHAHPPTATGFATAGISLTDPVLPEVILTVGPVPLAKYATPSTDEVPKSIAPYIKKHNAILLANHGVLTLGKDVTEALHRMERVEHLAKIMLVAGQLGGARKLNKNQLNKLLDTFKFI
ncbi:MAG: class II aldolase/adducin family protein [Candidatus Edwardsbacteria bacterium]|nr:class II aldolase/adducin family protein [Candidatus Edwardsbacteria bacterium]MBU1577226.1 class II aldolase/adducin family protein [Candidatus Edwardsbacteria bacterium]MBU2462478.1 class II aldolase/adducin family protein [Candidatus Edwardsbacteria bacterium]MBU2594075.1 class II aldolase/adducin family protein [Candidatus Edwardsbacteria bacterium]